MLPNFLVIGAPRSGTTWIERNLREHPDIFLPAVKEQHFFDRHYDKGIAHYEASFAAWAGQTAIGEATPDYLAGGKPGRDIPALIARDLPGVRLIASLRNPVERAYSRFWNSKAKFDHNAAFSFEEKLLDKPEFLREGLYADHLQGYFDVFPRERVLVLLYDDLVADGRAFMRRIYEFLEVDSNVTTGFENMRVNVAAGKRNLGKSSSLWFASRVIKKLGARRLSDRMRNANSQSLPEMSAETRRRLVEHYRQHNDRLAELIGCDLSAWNRI